MAYVTAAELKAYMKISASTDDALLETFCTRAKTIIDHRTNTTWEAAATSVKRFDAIGDVDDYRALSFGGLWCAELVTITNGDGTDVPLSAVVTEPRNAELGFFGVKLKTSANYVWTFDDSPEDAIAITAYWGRAKSPPEFVKAAAIRLAAWLYRQKDSGLDADRVLQTSDGMTIYPAALPRDVLDLLEPVIRR